MSTKIEWTEKTWNPVVGCTKVSPGCQNCYAERMAFRLGCMNPMSKYREVISYKPLPAHWNGQVCCDEKSLEIPLHWRTPRMIFVCSMSDLFHESVPFEFIDKVIETTEVTPWHTYQILTKRPERMLEYFKWRFNNADQHTLDNTKAVQWRINHNIENTSLVLPNLWLGVTAENQEMADKRIPILLQIPAAVRFVSIEPMLGDMDISWIWRNHDPLTDNVIDWAIVGGESGPKARLCKNEWIRNIVEQCKSASVPVFIKQIHKLEYQKSKKTIKAKVVKDINLFPPDLRIREYPGDKNGV